MKSRSKSVVLALVVLAVIATVLVLLKRNKPAATAPSRATAVTLAEARVREFPLWLRGIGTVQASNTVLVRPRVGGELQSVNFTEGQEVKAGDVLAQIDPRPYQAALDQALAQQAQDEAALANARREFNRARELVANNTESRQILDQREATLAGAEAQLKASQATVANTRLQLDFTMVRAPIAGRTGVRRVDAGNLVTANQPEGLVVVTQTRPISVVFTMPQKNFDQLRRGLSAAPAEKPLMVEALSDRDDVLARGTLDLLDNQIDPATGTLRLKATFPNEDQALWPGQFVNARVLVETLPQALVVPAESVQPGAKGPFAYVLKPDSTVEPRTLQLGPTADGETVVLAGLQAGDRVVRVGQNKLRPGARVEAAAPASTLARADQ